MAALAPIFPSKRVKDLTGRTFDRLTVLSFAGMLRPPGTGWNMTLWLCRCECGNEKVIRSGDLCGGNVRSCGCLRRGIHIKHGCSHMSEHRIWRSIRSRYRNPKDSGYRWYGARGVEICDRWHESFVAFYADMGPRPSPLYSVDRIDNGGHYEPGNCRWATDTQQALNKGHNPIVTFEGLAMRLSDWLEGLSSASGMKIRVRN